VDARLNHRFAPALRQQAGLDRIQDLVVAECQTIDVGPIQVDEADLGHGGVQAESALSAAR